MSIFIPRRTRRLAGFAALMAVWTGSALEAWDRFDGPATGDPEVVGSYSAGCIIGAEALPTDGGGWQVIQLGRNRFYGHPELIRFIGDLSHEVEARGLGLVTVGDIAQPRGGPMVQDHASHQVGLDVDIYLRLDLPRLPLEDRESVELHHVVDIEARRVNEHFGPAQAELLRLAASDPRVGRIFVNPPIKRAMCELEWEDRAFLGTLRPWFGHSRHMHVRLNCPQGSSDCVAQPPPPAGDGCGEELTSWLRDAELVPAPSSGSRRPPPLPPRCEALL
jgi:penicillin-insensitive murein DD-endopeptidase